MPACLLVGLLVVLSLTRPAGAPGGAAVARAEPAPAAPSLRATPAAPLAVGATGPQQPPDPDSLSGYVWPLPHARVTLSFGPTPWGTLVVDGQLFHDGVDMATFCGDRVGAAHDGVVLAAGQHFDEQIGWIGDLGPYLARLDRLHAWGTLANVVIVDDGDGYRAIYAHFASVVVKPGQVVRAGQLLGYEGRSGFASGCHLHFGLFSPLETARFGLRPDIVKRVLLPAFEVARIDPLRVLPWRSDLGLGPGDPRPPRPVVSRGSAVVSEAS